MWVMLLSVTLLIVSWFPACSLHDIKGLCCYVAALWLVYAAYLTIRKLIS
jgi:hypothetical protein